MPGLRLALDAGLLAGLLAALHPGLLHALLALRPRLLHPLLALDALRALHPRPLRSLAFHPLPFRARLLDLAWRPCRLALEPALLAGRLGRALLPLDPRLPATLCTRGPFRARVGYAGLGALALRAASALLARRRGRASLGLADLPTMAVALAEAARRLGGSSRALDGGAVTIAAGPALPCLAALDA